MRATTAAHMGCEPNGAGAARLGSGWSRVRGKRRRGDDGRRRERAEGQGRVRDKVRSAIISINDGDLMRDGQVTGALLYFTIEYCRIAVSAYLRDLLLRRFRRPTSGSSSSESSSMSCEGSFCRLRREGRFAGRGRGTTDCDLIISEALLAWPPPEQAGAQHHIASGSPTTRRAARARRTCVWPPDASSSAGRPGPPLPRIS